MMPIYTLIKPDADKLVLSIFLMCLYWITHVISDWSASYVHALAFPHLTGPLPWSVSLPTEMLELFSSYRQEVSRTNLHVLPVKVAVSFVCCYLASVFLVNALSKGNQEKQD